MSRLKLWAFAFLVVVAGGVELYLVTQWQAQAAADEADRQLQAAAAQLDARSQLLAAQASALAEAAARAPAVLTALSDGEGDATAAAAVAVVAAARGMPAEQARALLVGTSGPAGTSLRSAGKKVELQDPAGGLFAEPLRGARREGYVRAADAIWFAAAIPAGKGAVAVALPVDEGLVQALRAAAGADVSIAAGQARPVSTLSAADQAMVLAAARAPLPRPVDAGQLPALRTAVPFAPPVPLLLARVPAHRAQAVALRGMKAGLAVLSVPLARPAAAIATFQLVAAAVLLLLLLAGLLLGLLSGGGGELGGVPRELVQTADRIARGDFSARAHVFPGSLGTVASALNRAAEAAELSVSRAPPEADPFLATGGFAPPPAPAPDPFAPPPPPPPVDPLPAFPPPPEPLVPRAAAPAPRPPPPEPTSPDLFAPAPTPIAVAPRFPRMGNTVSGATSLTTSPQELAQVASTPSPGEPPARGRTPPPVEPDQDHWVEVFQEFVRVRSACGETVEGLTFDRFEAKLRQNRTSLMHKHDCRTVRFQVYVKDGRAAIRATPVK